MYKDIKNMGIVDKSTGQLLDVTKITKTYGDRKSFWKVYLHDFLSMLDIMDSKQVEIMVYILDNTSGKDNVFLGTYTKIARECDVSKPTIATVMKKLQRNGYISLIQNGAWRISPNLMIKGDETKRGLLLSYEKVKNEN